MAVLTSKFDGKLKKPRIKTDEILLDIANEIIIPDIQEGIIKEEDLNKKKYAPLSPSTIKSKAKKGYRREILRATGKLISGFKARIISGGKVLISIRSDRKEIARFLQVEGVRSKRFGKRKFDFFGISVRSPKKSLKFMVSAINKAVRNAR